MGNTIEKGSEMLCGGMSDGISFDTGSPIYVMGHIKNA